MEVPLQTQWNALLATALLGTDQRRTNVASPEFDFLSKREGVNPETNHEAWVLLASAYAATYRRAGQIPPTAPHAQNFPIAAAETRPYCAAPVAARLWLLLNNTPQWDLFLEELLAALARKGQIVPPNMLPTLLTWTQRSKRRRNPLIAPVIGERGLWLAALNDEWKQALQVDPADQGEVAPQVSSQQALYRALGITGDKVDENIVSKALRIFGGSSQGSHGRMVQQVMERLLELSKVGGTYYNDNQLIQVAAAVPPVILPELIHRIQQALAQKQTMWLGRLGEFLEQRLEILEEVA
jgi:hypothetical protein